MGKERFSYLRHFNKKTSEFMADLREIGTISSLGFAKRGKDLDVFLLTSESSFYITDEDLKKVKEVFLRYSKRFPQSNFSFNLIPIDEDKLKSFQETIEEKSRKNGSRFVEIKNVYEEGKTIDFAPFPDWSKNKPLSRQ